MGNVAFEDHAINNVQYLELFYFQTDTIENMICNTPHPSNDPTKPTMEPSSISNTTTTSATSQTSQVNAVQSTSSSLPGGNMKNQIF